MTKVVYRLMSITKLENLDGKKISIFIKVQEIIYVDTLDSTAIYYAEYVFEKILSN